MISEMREYVTTTTESETDREIHSREGRHHARSRPGGHRGRATPTAAVIAAPGTLYLLSDTFSTYTSLGPTPGRHDQSGSVRQ